MRRVRWGTVDAARACPTSNIAPGLGSACPSSTLVLSYWTEHVSAMGCPVHDTHTYDS